MNMFIFGCFIKKWIAMISIFSGIWMICEKKLCKKKQQEIKIFLLKNPCTFSFDTWRFCCMKIAPCLHYRLKRWNSKLQNKQRCMFSVREFFPSFSFEALLILFIRLMGYFGFVWPMCYVLSNEWNQ